MLNIRKKKIIVATLASAVVLSGIGFGIKSFAQNDVKTLAMCTVGGSCLDIENWKYIDSKLESSMYDLDNKAILNLTDKFGDEFYDYEEIVMDFNQQYAAFMIKEGYLYPEKLFDDVEKKYYYDALVWAYTNKYIAANSVKHFGVKDSATRRDAVNFIYNYLNGTGVIPNEMDSSITFSDVEKSDKSYIAVETLASLGILRGDNGKANLNSNVSRAQFITMLWRMAGNPSVPEKISFEDVSSKNYYYEAVKWAVSKGIVKGTTETTFEPNSILEKKQMMTFLYRYNENKFRQENQPEDNDTKPEETDKTTWYEHQLCEDRLYCEMGDLTEDGQCAYKSTVAPISSSENVLKVPALENVVYDIQNGKTVGSVKLFECENDTFKYNPVSGFCEMPSMSCPEDYNIESSSGLCAKNNIVGKALSKPICETKWTKNQHEEGWEFTGNTKTE